MLACAMHRKPTERNEPNTKALPTTFTDGEIVRHPSRQILELFVWQEEHDVVETRLL